MARNRCLVTGGAGFIGSHLVRLLLERGESVRVLDIVDPPPFEGDVEFIKASITDRDAVGRAMAGIDRVFHLAANPNLWARRKATFLETNLEGTETVLAAAARAGVERVVYCSTESILKARRRGAGAAGVDRGLAVDDMPGPYCRSKFLAERAAEAWAGRGLPVVIVSPTLPVGPGDRLLTQPTRMILMFVNGKAPMYLDCAFNMVDVRVAALGHVLAADKGRIGERYVLGGENLRMVELLGILEDLTGLPMPRMRLPYGLALAVGAISEFVADFITRRPPVAPLTGVRLARNPLTFDSTLAIRELGLPPSSVRAALADAIAWFEAEGLIERRLRRARSVAAPPIGATGQSRLVAPDS